MRLRSLAALTVLASSLGTVGTVHAQTTPTSVQLEWTTPGDDGLTGTAPSYDIRYSTSPITAGNWNSATQATGEPVPTSAGTTQSFTLTGLTRQTTYYVAMMVTDDGGNVSALSNVPSFTTPD